MQTKDKIFDDIAKMASGAVGAMSDVRKEIEAMIRHQLERIKPLNAIPRDEFEAVKAMAAKARAEQEAQAKRMEHLEKQVLDLLQERSDRLESDIGPEITPEK